ncbi:NUDIX domain-containing protein [Microbacterium sp. C5A9]|uniref:NUDIX hydrolase n=1 Tax=Microbacterium sp. C5A9 TaxID=2736663 RepID=UPI001F5286E5|nr:NUDIX domain-containing protein [Microbacterium sp. C5A9]MCI1019369.1 NUDIX domain-containing protein [Microbacterium sp. C5A9]
MTALGADMRELVAGYSPRSPRDRLTRADFALFFTDDEGPVARGDGPSHATASAFVFDPSLTQIALVFHGKGRFWVQPGGHLEDDASIVAAALRELEEETGIAAGLPSAPLVYDLDHHALSAAFGRCASHLDVGVALVVPANSPLTLSDESGDVRWWPVDALPHDVPEGFEMRVRAILERLNA